MPHQVTQHAATGAAGQQSAETADAGALQKRAQRVALLIALRAGKARAGHPAAAAENIAQNVFQPTAASATRSAATRKSAAGSATRIAAARHPATTGQDIVQNVAEAAASAGFPAHPAFVRLFVVHGTAAPAAARRLRHIAGGFDQRPEVAVIGGSGTRRRHRIAVRKLCRRLILGDAHATAAR